MEGWPQLTDHHPLSAALSRSDSLFLYLYRFVLVIHKADKRNVRIRLGQTKPCSVKEPQDGFAERGFTSRVITS